ncbi:MAG: LysR family transcriptional regulator [Paraclostridium sp.]
MQLNQLRYLIEVAETGSMNKASKNLFLSQPNLSNAIMSLEQEFNIKIFNRTNRGVELTKEGKDFLIYAKYIISQVDNIQNIYSNLSEEKAFTLEISSGKLFDLGVVLSELYKKIDAKKIKVSIKETYKEKVIDDVASMKSEIGIFAISNIQERVWKNIIEAKKLEFNPILKDKLYIYVGENSPLYNKQIINPEELNDYICVHLSEEPINALTYSVELDSLGFSNKDRAIYLNDKETIIQFILQTNAYVIGSGFNQIERIRGVKAIPLENESVDFSIGWVKRKKEELSEEAKLFLEVFLENLKNK